MRAIGAILATFFAMLLISAMARPTGERRTTIYPGTCPNGESWYLIEAHDDSVVLGCYDPDYEPEQ